MQTRLPIRGRVVMLALTVLLPLAMAAKAHADVAPEVAATLGQPAELGSGDFRWLGFKVYEAQLYTQQGKGFRWERPFALQLDYARKVRARVLLKASLEELERMEGAREDHLEIGAKLSVCFRDVRPGDRVVAAPKSADQLEFWVNGAQTCTLRHAGIRARYLGIWLSDQARDQSLAKRLRGAG
ncbi:chalcone isomerase family protein [Shimia abyssi]|uniref:Chalcone isomerase-like protein n=1 Tax=Shimia abyssi TaxID=1662395 RepID=A0A2P8FES9_9RHOB|nr:chalcone isomerase family protein [Shimia abyssi]PSL20230.1 chalcone isomerase-like protein [Shimia abyssi]